MKHSKKYMLVLAVFLFTATQSFSQTAVEYLNSMTGEFSIIKTGYFDYINQVAHGKSAKKAESQRQAVMTILKNSKSKISKMKAYNGKTELRDSMISYLNLSYNVMANDYSKIMDLEAIAEQSYDMMEAYVMSQEIANQKINKGSDMVHEEVNKFAVENNITMAKATEDSRDRIISIANVVMKFQSDLNLLLFKSSFQENQMIAAISTGNISVVQQSRTALQDASKEGLKSLDTIPSFKGDGSLEAALRNLLVFYQDESTNQIPKQLEFFLAKENFEKIKKVIDSKAKGTATQQDIDQYNAALEKYNGSIATYNAKNTELNTKRTKLINEWNAASTAFLDKHIPKK
ncbi:hypothetical protein [uncultured Cytophaga sp.]|uniref:LIC11966 family surface protein n=1 Tax=uncultured Cytophaga sp. TaxID=160238 RepID=UPI002613F58C|nr:hypothetical protein [uncultured Cytophaga sp.]